MTTNNFIRDMCEPHKIIEKEFTWDEFIHFVFDSELVGVPYAEFDHSRIELKNGKLNFWNGIAGIYCSLHEELNPKIKYGFGIFFLTVKQFQQIEVGQDDDGYPIMEDDKNNFKFVEKEIKLYKLRTF